MPGNRSQACADCVNLSALPGIHVFLQARHRRQTWMASDLGLARGPHSLECRKSGKPRLAVTSPAMTPRVDSKASTSALMHQLLAGDPLQVLEEDFVVVGLGELERVQDLQRHAGKHGSPFGIERAIRREYDLVDGIELHAA